MGRRVEKSRSNLEIVWVEVDADGNPVPGSETIERLTPITVAAGDPPSGRSSPRRRVRDLAGAAAAGAFTAVVVETLRALLF